MAETVIIVAVSVGFSLLLTWVSCRTGIDSRIKRIIHRAAIDAVLGERKPPTK